MSAFFSFVLWFARFETIRVYTHRHIFIIACSQTGDRSKLEKTGIPQKRIVVKPRSRKEDFGHQDVRTFTFFNMNSYIFNSLDVEVDVDKLRPLFSDESGYLSDAELVVDDTF